MPQLESSPKGSVHIVRVTTERIVNEPAIQALGEELLGILNNRERDRILLDFSAVRFMSSSALGILVRLQKRCREVSVPLKLCNIAPEILDIFKITKLHRIFDIHATQKEAVAAFAK
jgi:anti-sigma B factor antagonist